MEFLWKKKGCDLKYMNTTVELISSFLGVQLDITIDTATISL